MNDAAIAQILRNQSIILQLLARALPQLGVDWEEDDDTEVDKAVRLSNGLADNA